MAGVRLLTCPARRIVRALGAAALRFEADAAPVAIAPGLSCRSRLGSPDVMRGEETQIAGAIALHPHLGTGQHLLCLPGTHTKWAHLQDGQVRDFLTALTGELFALLRDGSTLMRAATAGTEARSASGDSQDGFERGIEDAAAPGSASLLHGLFAVRSRQLIDGRSRGLGALLSFGPADRSGCTGGDCALRRKGGDGADRRRCAQRALCVGVAPRRPRRFLPGRRAVRARGTSDSMATP